MWKGKHRDKMLALCLLNLREELFLGRKFKFMLKKSIVIYSLSQVAYWYCVMETSFFIILHGTL